MAVALVTAMTLPAAAWAHDAVVAFDWSVPPRVGFDRNQDGRVDYPTVQEIASTTFSLRLTLAPDTCKAPTGSFSWRVDGKPLVVTASTGHCSYTTSLPDQLAHDIELTVDDSHGIRTARQRVIARDWLIAGLGDSVAAGEGNPERRSGWLSGKVVWQEPRCHSSASAGVAQAAMAIERSDDKSAVTFVHLACSGATITAGLLDSYRGIAPDASEGPLPPQVEELRRVTAPRHVDAIVLSVGANDIHFSSIVVHCLRFDECEKTSFNSSDGWSKARGKPTMDEVVRRELATLPKRYQRLADELDRELPGVPVLVTEYFDPTRGASGDYCETAEHGRLKKDELEWADQRVLSPLNAAVRAAAAAHGWRLVSGVAGAFGHNGYCADDPTRYIRTVTESLRFQRKGLLRGAPAAGAFHPNEAGHLATAALIADQLRATLQGAPEVIAADSESDASFSSSSAPSSREEEISWWIQLVILAAVAALAGVGLWRWFSGRALGAAENVGMALIAVGLVLVAVALAVRDVPALAAALAGPGALALVVGPLHRRLGKLNFGGFEMTFAASSGFDRSALAAGLDPNDKKVVGELLERHRRLLAAAQRHLEATGYRVETSGISHGFDAFATSNNGRTIGVEVAVVQDRAHLNRRLREIRSWRVDVDDRCCVVDAEVRFLTRGWLKFSIKTLYVDGYRVDLEISDAV